MDFISHINKKLQTIISHLGDDWITWHINGTRLLIYFLSLFSRGKKENSNLKGELTFNIKHEFV